MHSEINTLTTVQVPSPHTLQRAEQGLIGLLLNTPCVAFELRGLSRTCFATPSYRRIFAHVSAAIRAGKPVDPVLLAGHEGRVVAEVGGIAHLQDIMAIAPSDVQIARGYVEMLRKDMVQRCVQADGLKIKALLESSKDSAEKIQEISRISRKLTEVQSYGAEPKRVGSLLENLVGRIQEVYEKGDPITGLRTGFPDLDKVTLGLQSGNVIVIAGRPAMGKSTLAQNIAENAVIEGKVVAIFDKEMSANQRTSRLVSSIGRIPLDHVLAPVNLPDKVDFFSRLSLVVGKLTENPLIIDDNVSLTVAEMHDAARRIKVSNGHLDLIVIDYIQLIPSRNGGANRQEQVAEISRELKLMARDLNVPVIVVAQLSRKVEERSDKRPLLSDLKESGAIEQDADIVIMLYRDDYYNKESKFKGLAECNIVKNRMGPSGVMIPMTFRGEFCRFESYAGGAFNADDCMPTPPPYLAAAAKPKHTSSFLTGTRARTH